MSFADLVLNQHVMNSDGSVYIDGERPSGPGAVWMDHYETSDPSVVAVSKLFDTRLLEALGAHKPDGAKQLLKLKTIKWSKSDVKDSLSISVVNSLLVLMKDDNVVLCKDDSKGSSDCHILARIIDRRSKKTNGDCSTFITVFNYEEYYRFALKSKMIGAGKQRKLVESPQLQAIAKALADPKNPIYIGAESCDCNTCNPPQLQKKDCCVIL